MVRERDRLLAHDLNENHSRCTLAYWHQPTFSSTADPSTSDSAEGQTADTWWKLLYEHHATLILNGHDHVYSRFAPMDPSGAYDAQGIREFIVGTGGESLDMVLPGTRNLQAWADQYYGIMKLTLAPGGYAWDYESAMQSPTAPAGTPRATATAAPEPATGPGRNVPPRHGGAPSALSGWTPPPCVVLRGGAEGADTNARRPGAPRSGRLRPTRHPRRVLAPSLLWPSDGRRCRRTRPPARGSS